MKHKSLMVLFMLGAWSVAGVVRSADTPPQSTVHPNAPVDEAAFKTLDIDRDGYVSRMEVRRGTNLERQFDQLDTNRDGRLSREELRGMVLVTPAAGAASRK